MVDEELEKKSKKYIVGLVRDCIAGAKYDEVDDVVRVAHSGKPGVLHGYFSRESALQLLALFPERGARQSSWRERLPDTRQSITRKFEIARPGHRNGDLCMDVTVGLYPDGRPGEIFIRSDLTGSFASGALDAAAMILSVAWQYGVPFAPTVEKLKGMRFEPQGVTGDPKYSIVSSPLDYVARWLLDRFGNKE